MAPAPATKVPSWARPRASAGLRGGLTAELQTTTRPVNYASADLPPTIRTNIPNLLDDPPSDCNEGATT